MPSNYKSRTIEDYEQQALDDPNFCIQVARERIEEWDYARDLHGYCHERTILMGLLAEIDRLRVGSAHI